MKIRIPNSEFRKKSRARSKRNSNTAYSVRGSFAPRRAAAAVPFIIACVILGVSALLLTSATASLKLHFKKHAVPIARPLKDIPATLGPWVQVTKDEPLDSDLEEVLGTHQYIFRWYVDSRKVPQGTIDEFANRSGGVQQGMVAQLAQKDPSACIQLAVTYYTGLVDTVAHIPDRCYVADGYIPSQYDKVRWVTGPGRITEARYIHFEDETGDRRKEPVNVAYFFRVNDTYKSDPLAVRWRLEDLQEKYGFYAKVELRTDMPDHAKSAGVMTDFLTYALPEIEKSWPDWKKVNAK